MMVVNSILDCRRERSRLGKLAFVPTMGALHAGHVSLMTLAKQHAQSVAVSIFVNPTQFAPTEDFNKYPRPIEADLEKCRSTGVDLIFMPTAQEMYRPELPQISINLPGLTNVLDGEHRPTHFAGVCQVVAKLFNIVQPDIAIFGKKDFQQLRILTAMVEALDFPIQIVPGPTVREPDGLAMSSRNQYLSPADRTRALAISRGLFAAQAAAAAGERDTSRLVAIVRDALTEKNLAIDYVAAFDSISLKPVQTIERPAILAVAARVGTTRLIDNIDIETPVSNPRS